MQKLTWKAVGLIAVIGATTVALAVFSGWTEGSILALAGILGGLGGGAAVVGGVAGRVEQVAEETQQQTRTLEVVQRQTNGMSTAERQDIADRAAAVARKEGAEELLALLREQGLIR